MLSMHRGDRQGAPEVTEEKRQKIQRAIVGLGDLWAFHSKRGDVTGDLVFGALTNLRAQAAMRNRTEWVKLIDA